MASHTLFVLCIAVSVATSISQTVPPACMSMIMLDPNAVNEAMGDPAVTACAQAKESALMQQAVDSGKCSAAELQQGSAPPCDDSECMAELNTLGPGVVDECVPVSKYPAGNQVMKCMLEHACDQGGAGEISMDLYRALSLPKVTSAVAALELASRKASKSTPLAAAILAGSLGGVIGAAATLFYMKSRVVAQQPFLA
jgi:hypothetical protein